MRWDVGIYLLFFLSRHSHRSTDRSPLASFTIHTGWCCWLHTREDFEPQSPSSAILQFLLVLSHPAGVPSISEALSTSTAACRRLSSIRYVLKACISAFVRVRLGLGVRVCVRRTKFHTNSLFLHVLVQEKLVFVRSCSGCLRVSCGCLLIVYQPCDVTVLSASCSPPRRTPGTCSSVRERTRPTLTYVLLVGEPLAQNNMYFFFFRSSSCMNIGRGCSMSEIETWKNEAS